MRERSDGREPQYKETFPYFCDGEIQVFSLLLLKLLKLFQYSDCECVFLLALSSFAYLVFLPKPNPIFFHYLKALVVKNKENMYPCTFFNERFVYL